MYEIPDDIRAHVSYDPATGVFTWLQAASQKRAGDTAGYLNSQGYWCLRFRKRQFNAHRVAWFLMTGEQPRYIDHRDGNRANNRFDNLRAATAAGNSRNRRHEGQTLKGVTMKRGRFRAQISVDGRRISLGTFDTEGEAHTAYRAAAVKYHGEFARLD